MIPSPPASGAIHPYSRPADRGSRLPRQRPRAPRFFSLMEILVVIAIITLALALVLPKVGRLPRRLKVARSLSGIRIAFRETAMRARAGGQAHQLTLDLDSHSFRTRAIPLPPLTGLQGQRPKPPTAPPLEDEEADPGSSDRPRTGQTRYEISDDVKWEDEGTYGEGEGPSFLFFPDGEASGEPLEFAIGRRRFRLDVDRLTGTPVITEILGR